MNRSDLSPRPTGERRYLAVAQRLLADIGRGRYAVGDALPADRELAVQLSVSRATVREALLALEFVGVIEVRHGAGTFVRRAVGAGVGAPASLDAPPRELILTRQAIEPVVAALTATHVDDATLQRVQDDLDAAAELVERPEELPQFVKLGLRFHADLASGCGNGLLASLTAHLVNVEEHPLWALLNQQAMSQAPARQRQIDEHRAILDAVAGHSPSSAERAMRVHLDCLGAAILDPAQRS